MSLNVILNITRADPEVVLDETRLARIRAAVEAALQAYPDRLSEAAPWIDVVARGDGTVGISTLDGGLLNLPDAGEVPPPTPAGELAGSPAPVVPPGAGPARPLNANSAAAARAYGGARIPGAVPMGRPPGATTGPLGRVPGATPVGAVPGSTTPRPVPGATPDSNEHLRDLQREVTTAENSALRRFLAAHQQDLRYDYQELLQALKSNHSQALLQLRQKHAEALNADVDVQQAREAVRNYKVAFGLPG